MPRLLPLDALIRTGPVDHADWNYRPLLGGIQRRRFDLVCRLLPNRRVERLLEVGYGSGILMPELADHCNELHGVDIHAHAHDVQERLRQHGVAAMLEEASAQELPYEDESFDAVIAASSLEFITDIAQAIKELHRVLRPTGWLICVTPSHSPLADFGLRVLTGKTAKEDFQDRRERLVPALLESFSIDRQLGYPKFLARAVRLYSAFRLRPIKHTSSQRSSNATVR